MATPEEIKQVVSDLETIVTDWAGNLNLPPSNVAVDSLVTSVQQCVVEALKRVR